MCHKTNLLGGFLTVFTLWWVGCVPAIAQAIDMSQKAKNLIEQIEIKTSQRPGWDEPSMAVENPHILKQIPEFTELQQGVGGAWPQIVKNIQTVAPSDASKAILFVALQSIPPDSYLQFLDQAVGLTEAKMVDKRLLRWALFPANKNVRGVLDYNYEKLVVKDILKRVKVLYASDPNMVKYCDAALAGETKKESEAYLNANPREPRPGPALQSATNEAFEPSSVQEPRIPTKVVSATPNSTVAKSTLVQFESPSLSFSIIPIAILAVIVGATVFFLIRRKS